MSSSIKGVFRISKSGFPLETADPFLFGVYHNDKYPAGDANMQAPRRGNGADFDMNADYRMYHGDKIPGFPSHPHKGLETVTCLMEGFIDHSDSLKKIGRYGPGDCQFMTSGRGIQHAEMFPLINRDGPNPLRFFQLWLNIPKVNKNCPPTQITHWAEQVPKIIQDGVCVTVWAGELLGKTAQAPPPHSYASNPSNKVGIFFIKLDPGSSFTLPAHPAQDSQEERKINRSLYFVSGKQAIVNKSSPFPSSSTTLLCDSLAEFVIENPGTDIVECLVLEGRPIGEPVAQRGPFVMNTQEELASAFLEYRMTQFGQPWPFSSDSPVHCRDRGRFVDLGDGKIIYPPL